MPTPADDEAIPRHDPLPSPRGSLARQFWRTFRLLGLFSMAVAGIAVVLAARGESGFHIHFLIATALGAGLTVLVGSALMTLIFLSNSSGHDQAAATPPDEGNDRR